MKARPAHVLRMIRRLSIKYPDLDFSGITTIGMDALQTRFEIDNLAGIHRSDNSIYIGLPDINEHFPYVVLSRLANTVLHEVIHRKQYSINPKSKAHGKLFQKLCLKYGLDPRIEIDHDEGQELKVKVPYEREFFKSGGGLCPNKYQDFYHKKDVSDDVFYASKALVKRGKYYNNRSWFFESDDDYCDEVSDVLLHQYHQHYPAYRFCDHIVKNYHITRAA